MSNKPEALVFYDEYDNEISLEVIEQTTIAGQNYLLAYDEEEDMVCMFREIPEEGDMASYEIVEDDTELQALLKVFNELIDDLEIEY